MNQPALVASLLLELFVAAPFIHAEGPITVELVGERKTWSYRYLADTLARDSRINAGSMLIGGREDIIPRLKHCSVLILMEVSPAAIRRQPEIVEPIQDFVVRGGGLIITSGESWRGEEYPFANLLPITAGSADDVKDDDAPLPSRPEITVDGLRSSMLRVDDDPMHNQQLWREELAACFGKPLPVSPDRKATVWAVDPRRSLKGKPIPLIAVRELGDGRVVFLNAPQLWRWRVKPIGNYHARIWKQLIRYADGADKATSK